MIFVVLSAAILGLSAVACAVISKPESTFHSCVYEVTHDFSDLFPLCLFQRCKICGDIRRIDAE